jgi:hypothetical protein
MDTNVVIVDSALATARALRRRWFAGELVTGIAAGAPRIAPQPSPDLLDHDVRATELFAAERTQEPLERTLR